MTGMPAWVRWPGTDSEPRRDRLFESGRGGPGPNIFELASESGRVSAGLQDQQLFTGHVPKVSTDGVTK